MRFHRLTRLTRLTPFSRCARGAAFLEFALFAPIVLLVAFGSYEILRLIHINHRLNVAAHAMADLLAQNPVVAGGGALGLDYPSDSVDTLLDHIDTMLQPYADAPHRVTATHQFNASAGFSTGPHSTVWTRSTPGLPDAGSDLDLTALPLEGNQGMMAVEVFYAYEPLFNHIVDTGIGTTMRRQAVYAARFQEVTLD